MTADHTSVVAWPPLAEPFASALREAVEFIFSEVDPIAIVATGTIIRGTAHASSDLDLCVLHRAPHRRRIQRFFSGVPAEIFVNPPSAVRYCFADEDRNGRRITAHMWATGTVIFRTDAIVDELRSEAAEWLARESRTSEFERTSTRYTIASQLEDALDVLQTDAVTATMLLSDVVLSMMEYLCKAETGRIPRRKDLLKEVGARDAHVAALASRFVQASNAPERAQLALEMADRVIGARGFFEWDSGPGPAPSHI